MDETISFRLRRVSQDALRRNPSERLDPCSALDGAALAQSTRASKWIVRSFRCLLVRVRRSKFAGLCTVIEFRLLVDRVRSEFVEMPGLRLTPAQAMRLWSVDAAVCDLIIETLVGSAFLRRGTGGTVLRADG